MAFKGLTRAFGKAKLTLKKNAPSIAIVGGTLVAMAGTAVAIYTTEKKVKPLIAETKEKLDDLHEKRDAETDEEALACIKKDITKTYMVTAGKTALAYSLPAAMLLGSGASVGAGIGMFKSRLSSTSLALAAATSELADISGRLVEKYGEKEAQDILDGFNTVKLESKTKQKNGEKKVEEVSATTKDVMVSNDIYRRVFDWWNPLYDRTETVNSSLLDAQMSIAQRQFDAFGYLFMDSVDEMLHFLDYEDDPVVKQRKKIGRMVGWYHDKNNPDKDNFINFRIREAYGLDDGVSRDYPIFRTEKDAKRAIESEGLDGYIRKVYLIDYNVDGNILADFDR